MIANINILNVIKPKLEEIELLQNEINICNSIGEDNSNSKILRILPKYFDVFKSITKVDLKNNAYAKKINYILDDLRNNNITITLKQISKKYKELYNYNISLTTVSRILKKLLNIKYLRLKIQN